MATTRILVVDDEEDLCEILKFNLEIEGYEVDTAYSAEEALKKDLTVYNLLLLDVMMGEISGFKMARILRQDEKTANTPIIFLTAKDTENDMLTGCNLGADDYMVKPFLPKELALRVSAILKRTYSSKMMEEKETEEIILGKCIVNFKSGIVKWNERGEEIPLTAKELLILKKLWENKGNIVTFDQLCQAVWQDNYFGYENTIMVHIRRLREKIEENPSKPKALLTVRGLGYKLVQ